MSNIQEAGTCYVVYLVPDDLTSLFQKDRQLANLDYTSSLDQLLALLEEQGGKYKGWHVYGGVERNGYAVIDVSPEVLAMLEGRDFVQRLPIPGHHPDICQADVFTIHKPSLALGGTC